jgi:hypothetical protein
MIPQNKHTNIETIHPMRFAIKNLMFITECNSWEEYCSSEARCNAAIDVFKKIKEVPFYSNCIQIGDLTPPF